MNHAEEEKRIKAIADSLTAKIKKVSKKIDALINKIASTSETSSVFWSGINVEIRALYEELRKITMEFISKKIPDEYLGSIKQQLTDLKYRSIKPPIKVKYDELISRNSSKQSLKSILNETMVNFKNGFEQGKNSMTRLANLTQQILVSEKKMNDMLAEGFLETGSGTGTKRKVRDQLLGKLQNGQYIAVIDKNGKTEMWDVDAYSELVIRTKLQEASFQGVVDTALATGSDLIQISSHNTQCAICAEIEGRIFSLSGSDPDFPVMDFSLPLHPNDMHSSSIVLREALQRDGTLQDYIEFSKGETEEHPTRRGFIPISQRKLA